MVEDDRPHAGDRVIANADGKQFKKGATGVVMIEGTIECENYFYVQLDGSIPIGPSLDSYWDKYKKE